MKKYNLLEALQTYHVLSIDDDAIFNTDIEQQKKGIISMSDYSDITIYTMAFNIIEKINNCSSFTQGLFYSLIIKAYKNNSLNKNTFSECNLQDHEIDCILNILKHKRVFEREYVDLGLPSKTLWGTRDINSNNYADFGDLGEGFFWGIVDNSKINNVSFNEMQPLPNKYMKYITSKHAEGFLMPEDDPAQHVNKHFYTPTVDQFMELNNNTNHFLTDVGYIVVSKENPLNFIVFNERPTLYMTSDILSYCEKISPDRKIVSRTLSDDKAWIYPISIIKDNQFNIRKHPYKIIREGIPPVLLRVKPVYK